jgi:hypothetical protein
MPSALACVHLIMIEHTRQAAAPASRPEVPAPAAEGGVEGVAAEAMPLAYCLARLGSSFSTMPGRTSLLLIALLRHALSVCASRSSSSTCRHTLGHELAGVGGCVRAGGCVWVAVPLYPPACGSQ